MGVLLLGILGIIGMLSATIYQSLLVFKRIKYEQTVRANLFAGLFIGLWLVSYGYVSYPDEFFPTGLAILCVAVGLSYIFMIIGFWIGGEKNKLFILASVIGVIAYSVWAFWLGRLFLSDIVNEPKI